LTTRRIRLTAALLLVATRGFAAESITIDGRLTEPEWASAQLFTDFRVTEPLTREPAPYRTELRLLARPEGLTFGMRMEIPRDQRTHGRSPRDAEMLDADPIIVFVDFEGRGRTAYEFTVSLSGSQRDSVVLNQTTNSRDWDAVWESAVTEDDAGWTAEMRIPWSVAPEGIVNGDRRTIGFYVSRFIKKNSTRHSLPAIELFSSTFVQGFQHVEVPRFKTSSLDVVPYVSVASDFLNSATTSRQGLDVVWKPNGGNLLAATLKPDFGQVESDDLVVNFSAIETFFSDKRPFFTEGLQLFDLRLPFMGRVINTRRIGGAPDVGPEGATEVLAGAKYAGGVGNSEYGAFASIEENSSQADGRTFLAGRWHRKLGSMNVGYLGTYVDHPTIDRKARVHAIDFDATFGEGFILNAQAMMSDIRDPALQATSPGNDGRGYGGWTTLLYQPGGKWQHSVRFEWLDRRFEIDDFGYVERSNVQHLQTESFLNRREYPKSSVLASSYWFFETDFVQNDSGDKLPGWFEVGRLWQWKNGDGSYFSVASEPAGFDDLILRGNGKVRLPAYKHFWWDYYKADSSRFRLQAILKVFEDGIDGWTRELRIEPKYFFTESLSVGLKITYDNSDRWLIWTGGAQLGTFQRQQLVAALDAAWYPAAKQELRLKAQWAGLRARFRQAYGVGANFEPVPMADQLADFSQSNVALQLRYRYEIGPLSDFYVVYNRGGDFSEDSADGSLTRGLSDAWHNPTSDAFLVKLRYRF